MAKAGLVDSDSVESALENGGYCGLAEALRRKPEEVIAEVESSGLTGRGGAGFPVGRKWRFVAQAPRTPKYIVCNADESEPLIFKDRVLIDTNPHQILEGMAIAGYATGAQDAFIYIRGEYSHQAERLENAIHQAESKGWLGENIQGGGYSFRVHVHRGAGAYICCEETKIRVVPNPYIVVSRYQSQQKVREIRFMYLPPECTISVYTVSGVLVKTLYHQSTSDGSLSWNLVTNWNHALAFGVYVYVVEAPSGDRHLGKFALIK